MWWGVYDNGGSINTLTQLSFFLALVCFLLYHGLTSLIPFCHFFWQQLDKFSLNLPRALDFLGREPVRLFASSPLCLESVREGFFWLEVFLSHKFLLRRNI
jgi:hypothetical protein